MNETKLTDEKVKELLKILSAKKAEVANAEKPMYVTGGQFRFVSELGQVYDLSTIRDERKLVEILTFLKERSKHYEESAIELGSDAKFTWLGFTYDEWFSDLKTRINVLQIAKRRTELAVLEARVTALISPELKAQMEFEELSNLLK